MRRSRGACMRARTNARYALVLLFGLSLVGCDPDWLFSESASEPPSLRPTWSRASLRAYDGAPPVIPHRVDGGSCTVCHDQIGREIPSFGIAPPNPHTKTPGLSAARCQQCHVPAESHDDFAQTSFNTRWWTGTRAGTRLYQGAPPVAPHRLFMHEDCASCHSGIAARPEIRTTHPERTRCQQCHAFANTDDEFVR